LSKSLRQREKSDRVSVLKERTVLVDREKKDHQEEETIASDKAALARSKALLAKKASQLDLARRRLTAKFAAEKTAALKEAEKQRAGKAKLAKIIAQLRERAAVRLTSILLCSLNYIVRSELLRR
jgi:hypothetical protein